LEAIIRPNILALQPYRCARDDYQSGVLMDANENAYGHSIASTTVEESSTASQKEEAAFLAEHIAAPLHRYPDPSHPLVKSAYASLRGISGPERVFLGVGSDEVIDLLFRVTCVPGKDKILACPPTYGMYSVCAQVNDVAVVNVPQDTTFSGLEKDSGRSDDQDDIPNLTRKSDRYSRNRFRDPVFCRRASLCGIFDK